MLTSIIILVCIAVAAVFDGLFSAGWFRKNRDHYESVLTGKVKSVFVGGYSVEYEQSGIAPQWFFVPDKHHKMKPGDKVRVTIKKH